MFFFTDESIFLNCINGTEISPIWIKLFEQVKTGLSKKLYYDLLDNIFNGKLKVIKKFNYNSHIIINTQMRLICNLCKCKLPRSYEVEAVIKNLVIHITGKNHIKNSNDDSLYLPNKIIKSDLDDDVIEIPNSVMSEIFISNHNKRNIFSGYILVYAECKLCNVALISCNKIKPIQNTIHLHVFGKNHSCKYFTESFKNNLITVNSADKLKSVIDDLYIETKTFLQKNLYLDLLINIYQGTLKQIPECTDKLICIMPTDKINVFCNMCDNTFTYSDLNKCKNELSRHTNSKKHKKLIDSITSKTVSVPDNMFTITDLNNLKIFCPDIEIQNMVIVFLNISANCKLCNNILIVNSNKITDVRDKIFNHILNNKHVNKYIKYLYSE